MRYEGLNVDDPLDKALLDSCQMGILKGHGRIWSAYCFLNFGTAAKGSILDIISKIPYQSANKQFQDARLRLLANSAEQLFCSLSLSSTGFAKLGYAFDNLPADISFRKGMKWASKYVLDDPPLAEWDHYFQNDVDALIVFASDDEQQVDASINSLEVTKSLSREQLWVIKTRIDKNLATEHFGFVDGVSQPLFFREDIAEYAAGKPVKYDPTYDPRDILVTRFPQRQPYFGSYLVFRKIQQDVAKFDQSVDALASTLDSAKEFVEAQVLGRFKDGTPLALSPSSAASAINNFTYDDDAKGLKCPHHSHVRKMNIRSPEGDDSFRIIARRGVPYEENANSGKEVGLLFLCYQNDIGRQFEFLQSKWANDPKFPVNVRAGVDPVIGHAADGAQRWQKQWGVGDKGLRDSFASTTKFKGGEYFFTPSPLLLNEWRSSR